MVPPASHRIPRVLWYSGTGCGFLVFDYAAFTLSGEAFQPSSSNNILRLCRPSTPRSMLPGLGSSLFARRYSGNRFFFLLLRVLRCFSSPGSLHHSMYSCVGDKSSTCRVSPFGYSGIEACLRLPLTFRSLPRPSSALGALASTLCSSSLDYSPETPLQFSSGQLTFFIATGLSRLFSSSSLCSCQGAREISLPSGSLSES